MFSTRNLSKCLITAGRVTRTNLTKFKVSSVHLLDQLNREEGRRDLAISMNLKRIHIQKAVVETAKFFWAQTKVFGNEIATVAKTELDVRSSGRQLTQTESARRDRVSRDILKTLAMSPFAIIPFLELALPAFLKFFPNALPSVYADKDAELAALDKIRENYRNNAESLANIFREVAAEVEDTNGHIEAVLHALKTESYISSRDISHITHLDKFSLNNLSLDFLITVCQALGVPLPKNSLSREELIYKIRAKHQSLVHSNRLINPFLPVMTLDELKFSCRERGLVVIVEEKLKGTDEETEAFRRRLKGYDRMGRYRVPTAVVALVTAHNNNVTMLASAVRNL